MESIRIDKTQKTPLFILKDGYIRLSGRSIPHNSRQLYKVCFDWIEKYIKSPANETKVDLFFEYIDTSSIRCVMEILYSLGKIPVQDSDKQVEVNWYYENEDDDAFDLGVYIQTHLKVPVNIIPVEGEKDVPEYSLVVIK
jgi:hypothetical protein